MKSMLPQTRKIEILAELHQLRSLSEEVVEAFVVSLHGAERRYARRWQRQMERELAAMNCEYDVMAARRMALGD